MSDPKRPGAASALLAIGALAWLIPLVLILALAVVVIAITSWEAAITVAVMVGIVGAIVGRARRS